MQYRHIVSMLVFCATFGTFACEVTMVNDTKEDILVLTIDAVDGFILFEGETVIAGTPDEHAEFYVYTKTKERTYALSYYVKQYRCSESGKFVFKTSSLAHQTYDHKHFTVEDYTD